MTSYLFIQYFLLGMIVYAKSSSEKRNLILAFAFFSIAIEDLLSYFALTYSDQASLSYYSLLAIYHSFEYLTQYLFCLFFLSMLGKRPGHFLFAPHALAVTLFIVALYYINWREDITELQLRVKTIISIYSIIVYFDAAIHIRRYLNTQNGIANHLRLLLYYGRVFLLFVSFYIIVVSIPYIIGLFVGVTNYTTYVKPAHDFIHLFLYVPCQTVIVLLITYVLLIKPELLNALQEREGKNFEEKLIKVLAAPSLKQRMSDEKYDQIITAMVREIEEEKIYLNPDITIGSLAQQTNTKPHDLSYVINRHYGKNFNAQMNYFRIEHAKQMLEDQSHNYTIYQVALDSGFNTESVFYTTFKRLTGLSPLEYRKRYQEPAAPLR